MTRLGAKTAGTHIKLLADPAELLSSPIYHNARIYPTVDPIRNLVYCQLYSLPSLKSKIKRKKHSVI